MAFLQANRWTERTVNPWDEALLGAARRPAQLLIWLIGLGWVAHALNAHWPEPTLLMGALQWHDVGLVISVAWFLWKLIGLVTQTSIRRRTDRGEPFDLTTALALGKLLRLLVIVVTVITVAHTLGFQIGGLLALGGVGGIAVGLAAKDLLANFFGGLTIYLDRPFSVGDWIRSPDKSIEGTVEYISWRHTLTRAWVDYLALKQELLAISHIVASHGAGITFPTQTLRLESAPESTPPVPDPTQA